MFLRAFPDRYMHFLDGFRQSSDLGMFHGHLTFRDLHGYPTFRDLHWYPTQQLHIDWSHSLT
jgi:hypothetical protein